MGCKKGNGDDADECAGSAEEESDGSGNEWDNSGEESDDGSVEEYSSDGLLDVDVNDDADFEKNIDVNVEYGGLSNVDGQPQQAESGIVGIEVNYSDEGSLMGSDGEEAGLKWPKYLQDLEGSCPLN